MPVEGHTEPSTAEGLGAARDRRARTVAVAVAVRRRRLSPEERDDIERIEAIRSRLLADQREIEIVSYGVERGTNRSAAVMDRGVTKHDVLGDVCRRSSSNRRKAMFLYGLVRELAPQRALELGTCLGISGAYQALALRHAGRGGGLITLEGAPAFAEIAEETFASLGLENIEVRVGRFRDTLSAVLAEGPPEYAFIDGHHDEKATLAYFKLILSEARNAVLVFDDIRWSDGMWRAWQMIARDPRVGYAVDLNKYGVVFTGGAGLSRPAAWLNRLAARLSR